MIQELEVFTLNKKYGAWPHRTPYARLLSWAHQEQGVPLPLHPPLSAPFACSPSSSSSEAPLTVRWGKSAHSPSAHKLICFTILQDDCQTWLEANGRGRWELFIWLEHLPPLHYTYPRGDVQTPSPPPRSPPSDLLPINLLQSWQTLASKGTQPQCFFPQTGLHQNCFQAGKWTLELYTAR